MLQQGRETELRDRAVADSRIVRPLLARLYDPDHTIRERAARVLGHAAAALAQPVARQSEGDLRLVDGIEIGHPFVGLTVAVVVYPVAAICGRGVDADIGVIAVSLNLGVAIEVVVCLVGASPVAGCCSTRY